MFMEPGGGGDVEEVHTGQVDEEEEREGGDDTACLSRQPQTPAACQQPPEINKIKMNKIKIYLIKMNKIKINKMRIK
jgi:hypothetical protein